MDGDSRDGPQRARLSEKSALLLLLLGGLSVRPAYAGDFSTDAGIDGRWGLSLTLGTSWRASKPDPALIGRGNGGTASSNGFDDGNLNYGKGTPFSTIGTALGELELRHGNYGVFLRGKAWYDVTQKDGNVSHGSFANGYTPNSPLNDQSFQGLSQFSGAKILDAYAFGKFQPTDDSELKIKVGNHVVTWGEGLFIGSGINQYNIVDAATARRPGAEVKEYVLPVPQISANLGLGGGVSLEAFYQFQWKPDVLDGCGTYWSAADNLNCSHGMVVNVVPSFSDLQLYKGVPSVAGGLNYQLSQAPDRTPKNSGQFGLAAHYYAAAIGTDFGAYFVNYNQRTPIFSTIRAASASNSIFNGRVPGVPATQYFFDYSAQNIKVLGLSAATTLGGASVFSEFSYTNGYPVQINVSDFTNPIGPLASRVAAVPVGGIFQGYDLKDKTQLQLGVAQSIARVAGAESLTLSGEAGFQHWLGIGNPNASVRYGRSSLFGAAAWNGGPCPASTVAAYCGNDGYDTANAWGYRILAQLSYPNVFGVNLKPRLVWSQDVSGYSADNTFLQGRQTLSLGLLVEYLNRYSLDFSVTHYNHHAKYDIFHDRDYYSLSMRISL
ncbi:DUF1302 domain-containing protein [Burkholderia sp. BCC1977]|uniref:DUF1302 domain-containing protein n=1 Tax=Burkholderia sp. BCC1977 TaxID=2817440 RepID=UPI002ABD2621|nr:DUF1302 domain-containing protein [Burkholderia sp. BCC1977]